VHVVAATIGVGEGCRLAIIRAISGWTPRTPVYYGWVVLTMAALGTYASNGVSQIVLGGVQNLISADTGWDRSTIAFAVTTGTWVSGLLTPIFGRLADRHGPRGLMPAAALVTGLCFFALAGSRGLWQFYTAYIVARAIGNPNLVGVVPRTVAVNFFQRRRNLALSITSTFRPISGAVNIQLISLIAVAFSWRAAYRYLGVFARGHRPSSRRGPGAPSAVDSRTRWGPPCSRLTAAHRRV
jgi:MFS family permease